MLVDVYSSDLHQGIVIVPDDFNHFKGDVIRLKAVPSVGYDFMGWFQNDLWLSNDPIYMHEVKESKSILAKFDEMIHVLMIEKIIFKVSYNNLNNDLFQVKTASLKLMILEIDDQDLINPISFIDVFFEEESRVVTKNHETETVFSYQPSTPFIYEIRSNQFEFKADQAWGFHLQYVSGQQYSSQFLSFNGAIYKLGVTEEKMTVTLDLYQASYANLSMEVT